MSNLIDSNQKVNKNNWWLCMDTTELPVVIHTKLSMIIMAIVSSESHVLLYQFFLQSFKFNATTYIKMLKTVIKLLIE